MTNETFLNIEFYRTLISVLIGGLISLGSVLIIEYFKNKKERSEKKREIFNGLISTVNQLRRIEMKGVETQFEFNYHRRVFNINEDPIAKEQAEYYQKLRDGAFDQMIVKAEMLDSFSIMYQVYIGNDDTFLKLMHNINEWPRPNAPDYREMESLSELNEKYNRDLDNTLTQAENHWLEAVDELSKHIKKKLL